MNAPSNLKDESFFAIARQTADIYREQLFRYQFQFALALVLLPFGVIFLNILTPLIVTGIIDRVAVGGFDSATSVWDEFGSYIMLFALSSVIGNIVWRINGFIFSDYQTKAIRDLEGKVFDWLSDHSYAFFANSFSGALVAQHKRFIGSFERIIDMLYWDIYRTVIYIIFSIAVIAYYAPLLGLYLMLFTIAFLIFTIWLNAKKSRSSRIFAAADTAVTARIADVITNVLTVKVFSSRKEESDVFAGRIDDKRLKFRRVLWLNEWIFSIQGLLIVGTYVAVWYYTLELHFNGSITVGTLLLVWLYWVYLSRELFFIGRFVGRIEFGLSDAAEMTKILKTPHAIRDPDHPEQLAISAGAISFKDVVFSYEDDSNKLFNKLSLEIPAGQKIGLVGPSGGGKTTITKLLLRFSDVQSGAITIDDQNIANITQDDARDAIAYVPQEPLLFHRTLKENIGYSQDMEDMEAIRKAAQDARADHFIDKLDLGYDTLVGERGIKLSGGEKQRVAIARAILKESPIIILDEATSALDSKSEKLIQEALNDLMKNKTAIVIAHRLSTIQKLDRIIVIENGKIAEDGTHKQLIAKKGIYADLWSHQTGGFIED